MLEQAGVDATALGGIDGLRDPATVQCGAADWRGARTRASPMTRPARALAACRRLRTCVATVKTLIQKHETALATRFASLDEQERAATAQLRALEHTRTYARPLGRGPPSRGARP